MKKTFQLQIDGKNRDRVIESIKHEIRQYMRRERRKTLPDESQVWYFDCRFGLSADDAAAVHPAQLGALIDTAASDGAASVYVEIFAKLVERKKVSSTDAAPDRP